MAETPFVTIAKALADPTRHRILREIRAAGEMTCSDVCERFRLAQPTISHHIKTLANAGVVKVRTEGQFHVLSVNERVMRTFAAEVMPNGRAKAGAAKGPGVKKKSAKKAAAARR
jgi:ArsR family transcriptional regulator